MPLSAWDKTRVYATWYTHTATRIPGTWKVTMPARVTMEDGEAIIPAGVYATGELWVSDETRPALDIMVPSNQDPDVTPLGWQIVLEVTLTIPGGARIVERYQIDTPLNGEVNLRTIPLAQNILPSQNFLLRGVAGGVAALDSEGRVVDADGNPVSVDPDQVEGVVRTWLEENPLPGGGPINYDDVPAGSTFTVAWNGTAWPTTRPSARADLTFIFRGGSTAPVPPTCLPGSDLWAPGAVL